MANFWDEYERDLFSEKKKKEEKPASSNIWDDIEQEHFNPKPQAGLTASQFSSSIDRYQAGLYGVGEAVAGAVGAEDSSAWLKSRREENERLADKASQRARDLGAVDRWDDVHGVGDFGSYAKGLAIQSLPYAGEALAGGALARGAMSGTRAALTAATAAKDVEGATAAARSLTRGSLAGATAASYPSSVGDILQNQREQAGTTDLGAAAALGVPYAGLNALGETGILAKGALPRNPLNILDSVSGVKGGVARAGAAVVKTGSGEAVGETGQEVINQMGRMAVDPNATLTDPEALERYKESAIGGFALGGLMGGATGWRRSQEGSNDVADALKSKDAIQPGVTTTDFTPPVAPPVAPAVVGGSTDIAVAQQQAKEAEAQAQAAQQVQVTREQALQDFSVVTDPAAKQGQFLGKPIFGPLIEQVGDAIAPLDAAMEPHQRQITQAVIAANAETGGKLISFSFNANNPTASVQKGFEAIAKAANKFQIAHVQSAEEAAQILDAQSSTAKKGELDQINAIHFALTGKDTSGYIAAQQTKATKGAKDDKLQLQTTPGLGTVPVEGATGEAISGADGGVRPTEVQPVGTTSVGAGPLGEQAGQLPAGGVRPSTGDVSNVGGGQAPSSQVIEGANVQAAQGNDGGRESGQPKQADNAQVDSQGVRAGPRRYAEPPSYYATDLAHIKGERRIEIIKQLFAAALAPKTARKNTVPAETRAEFLRLALMEQLPHKTIAELTGVKLDTVEKQLERMGVELVDGQFEMTDPTLAQSFVSVAADYRSPEFPDGLGEAEVLALYTTRYEADEVEGQTLAEEIQAGEQEGKPQAKLAEELYSKDNAETKTMGTISSAGGSQGAVEATDDAFFAKVGRLQALLDTTPETDEAGRANLAKQIEAQWAQYAKKQANRAETGEVEVAPTEDEDAVQEPSAEEVPVRKRAKGGKAVGKRDTKGGKAAAEGEAKDNADEAAPEIKTPREQYEALAESTKVLPPYDSLDARERAQVEDQAHQGELTLASLNTMFSGNAKFGADARANNPYTVAELTKELKAFTRTNLPTSKLTIVESVADLLMSPDTEVQKLGAAMALNNTFGVAHNGRAFLIANRIEKGRGRAKFMHEVGAHLGLENLLPESMYKRLTQQIVDWAKADNDTVESILAVRAAQRVMNANTPKEDQRAEMLAYFVEEAVQFGIDPTATQKAGALREWMRTLMAAFKEALRRLGLNTEALTARDVVDMAFGAAQLEMTEGKATGPARPKFGFAGVKATGAATEERQAGLVAAQMDLANGEDPKVIWEKTGWYKGTDGQWRFEIDDTNAQFKGVLEGKKFSDIARMEETTLDQILDHEELFQNYPELRDVKFEVRNIPLDFQRATQGWFDAKQNKLFVTPYAINPLSTVLHEVQHWIQSKEGFENGANPSGSDLSNKAALRKLRAELVAHIDRAAELEADRTAAIREGRYRSTFDEALRGFKARDLLPAVDTLLAQSSELAPKYAKLRELDTEIDRLEKAKTVLTRKHKEENKKAGLLGKVKNYTEQTRDLRVYTDKLKARTAERDAVNAEITNVVKNVAGGSAVAHEIYRLVAGEAEARNTQSRQNMSAAERRASFPESTMDVRPENTIRAVGREGTYLSTTGPRFGTEMSARLNEGLDNVLPASVSKPAKSVVTNLATAAKNGLLAAGITEDIVNMAGKYMRSAQDYLTAQYARQKTRLDFEQKIESILDAFDKLPKALQGEGAGSVNRYILDSTMAKKWGYYPGEHRIGTTLFEVDPDLEKRFNAFPADAQQVIRDVFEHGYTALKAKSDAIDAAVEREFAERTKAAQGDADLMDEVAQAKKLMRSQLGKIQNVDFTTPYAYLGRYGDYVVAAKSAEFKYWEGVAAEKGENKERAAAWLAENVSNPDHYVVQFAETQGEADQIAADLMATGKFDMDGTEAGPKEDVGSFIGSDVHLAVARLRNLITRQGGEDGEGTAELNRMVSDLYLMTAAENSARKSEIMRKYVSGANGNMMRNLATSGRADAHFLSTMKHNDEVIDALERMRNEAKNNVRNAMPLYNELFKRQTNSLEYKSPSTLSHALTQATSLWFLSTSPAFYLQQLLQTTVLSLPYMSGRLGYFRSVRAIKGAYRDVGALVKGLNVNEHIDFSKAPADVRAMLQTLVGMGKIDIGIDADAKARAGENNVLNTVMRKLQGVNNRIEAVNRATAAIAAYRGYIQRYGAGNTDAATKFAAEVVSNTHGSYDGFNTPRILSSDAGRLVGQFKRFQIIQLSMLGKLINTAFKGASPEERVVARRALSFITGHMAVVGGALGVPFVQQVGSLLLSAFGDDDEPKDLEYKLRQAIGDETMANLLLNGVPAAAGVNLGGKLGMGNVASILPFTDVDLSTRSGYEKVVVGLMGPFFGGLAPKMIDGAGMMAKGEYYKGLELLMPNGIGNAMKGVRYANEGVTMRNGDVVLKPEEISMVDAAFQSVGLPTTTITGRQYAQKVTAEFDQFYSAKAAEIKGAYVNANRAGDTEGMAEARKDWEDLQASRKRNGYKIQPMSELFKAMVSARKREAGVVEGVETNKSNKEFVKNII